MQFQCGTCQLAFVLRDDLKAHYKEDLHRENLKRKVSGMRPLSHHELEQLRILAAAEPIGASFERERRKQEKLTRQLEQLEDSDADDDALNAVDDCVLGEDQCFFSGKIFESMVDLLESMAKNFGFYLPDAKYIRDLDGLMDYLRRKVLAGHCLFCSRRFRSTQASLAHMIDKSHCKLNPDDGGFNPEIFRFYDFGDNRGEEWDRVEAAEADDGGEIDMHCIESDAGSSAGDEWITVRRATSAADDGDGGDADAASVAGVPIVGRRRMNPRRSRRPLQQLTSAHDTGVDSVTGAAKNLDHGDTDVVAEVATRYWKLGQRELPAKAERLRKGRMGRRELNGLKKTQAGMHSRGANAVGKRLG
eukprot:SAG31_NODE_947_length_10828_cov_3.713953_2_plen_361_part_00